MKHPGAPFARRPGQGTKIGKHQPTIISHRSIIQVPPRTQYTSRHRRLLHVPQPVPTVDPLVDSLAMAVQP